MGSIEASGIRRMFEMTARLKDPINLSIGQADFDPPEVVVEAAVEAMRAGHNRYTETQGGQDLNQAICDLVARRFGRAPESSIVTTGVSGGLLLSFLATLNPGDEILIPDPYFMLYCHQATIAGATYRCYDTYPDFRVRAERIEPLINERTRILLINSPQNPTGSTVDESELRDLADLARRHGLLVISDEIYDAFVYDAPHASIYQFYEDTILLGGFSKTYGVAGWRLGYAVGPSELVEQMRTLQQFTFVCAPAPLQRAALTALDCDMSDKVEAYRRKRDLVCEKLASHFQVQKPGGSFYAFPQLPDGVALDRFIERAIERQVLVVPGSAFSPRKTHFRLSFAVADDKLSKGLDLLCEIAEELA
ncbi:MAG: pyridoxal phosphate-dependent aminotransferase [Planctomycetes bacterium]|nr:pyridoxal phosphate-dependent aminotransferase [Planctomycetota bacterium]